jgi:signal transduction histidine kinase/DNA-binding response OmpR family regulator
MFFGGNNGFNFFHPDSIQDNPNVPPVAITAFEKLDTDHPEQGAIAETGISAKSEIALTHKNAIFSIEFAALNYVESHKNRYAYKLEGFNDNWIQLGTRRRATFTNLDPGEYVFRVKGSNNDGVWNEEGASLRIIIRPPWWKTWWAYALYGAIFFGLLYSLRRYEMNRQQFKHRAELEHVQVEKLQELDHLKSRFFANISHEFRTPLTLILAPIEDVLARVDEHISKKDLKLMQRSGQRLLRLINQMLDLAKLEAGKMQLQASDGDIVRFLRAVTMAFESQAARKQIVLRFRAEPERIIVCFDRKKLEDIMHNLLSNALKFTPPQGEITVAVAGGSGSSELSATAPATATVTVSDTGIGIPASHLPHIFDRFYRVEDSSALSKSDDSIKAASLDQIYTTRQEGIGIGLALVKELVELHHGSIQAESEEGKGTTFTISLPLAKAHLKPEEIEASGKLQVASEQVASEQDVIIPSIQDQATSGQQPETSNQEIVLVIEDNDDLRTYLREHLEREYKVMEAGDGEEGVEKALAAIPDLVISDVMMPKKDGYQVCAALKTDEKTSHIPVILLTAKAAAEEKMEGLETGADDYIVKPFNVAELLVRARNLIALRRKLRERFKGQVILKPSEIAVTSKDEAFLNRVLSAIEKHIGEEEFGVEELAGEAAMSRSQIHRKLQALTGRNCGQFILSVRLQRAAELLRQKAATVSEIAYQTGFGSPSYFVSCFKKQFGCTPSEYH